MGTAAEEHNKAFVLEAFDTLFNRRAYAAVQRFWSPDYIQHSAHIEAAPDGLFNLIKASPLDLRYGHALTIANGLLAEDWDVLQDEVTAEESKSGLPMFRDTFPTRA
jgi:predicted SnoaL-like aldol condensation-catalyzing enzyme